MTVLLMDDSSKPMPVCEQLEIGMSSSNLVALDETSSAVDSIILPGSAIEGLKPVQVNLMKETVATVNNNTRIAGEVLRSTASALYELKSNLVNKQWIAFLKSGALPIPEKQARDLTAAWEGWLRDSDVTDGDLVSIGTRTMAKIKSLAPEQKKKAISKIKSGDKVTESMIDELGGKKVATNKKNSLQYIVQLEEENAALKKENEKLKSQIEAMTAV